MCGIAGLLCFNGQVASANRIQSLTDHLAHRGRDSSGYIYFGSNRPVSSYPGIALGHRRLSIIDLSTEARQPMYSSTSSNVITYNGELYNYIELRNELISFGYNFRTKSDTEVILAGYDVWGESCVRHFNGMFAFAIWDEEKKILFCARDPIGIKPFYYTLSNEEFSFASESQALIANNSKNLSREAVTCYLLMMYVPRELSIYSGVKKLLPGHSIKVSQNGSVKVEKFWNPFTAISQNITFDDAVELIGNKLNAAVWRQLRSDVPVGILLSGGFDSGMILASAASKNSLLHSYSIGYSSKEQESELEIAFEMANRYKTKHHERIIKDDEVMPILNNALASLSEPVADTAIVPTYCLSEMAAFDGVKVLLSGTGGDEVFGGYSRYVASSFSRGLLYSLPESFREFISKAFFPNTFLGLRLSHRSIDMMAYTGGSANLAKHLFNNQKDFLEFVENIACSVFPKVEASEPSLYKNMMFDLQVYLPDLLLMYFDQLTMAHTIEGRVPLVDLELLAAAYQIPANYHANPKKKITRKLIRRMAEKYISSKTLIAKKNGFSGPVISWLKQNKQEFKNGIMNLKNHSILGDLPLENLWNSGVNNPTREWAMKMFSLYCFAIWSINHE